MDIVERVRNLIAHGRLGEAIDGVKSFITDRDSYLYDQILLQSSRLSRLEDENIKGLITFNEYSQNISKISYAILNMLNDIEKYQKFQDDNSSIASNNIFIKGNTNTVIQGVKNSSVTIDADNQVKKDFPKTIILFLASNPTGTAKLQLAEEFRRVAERLQEGGQFNKFEFYQEWQTTINDLQESILKRKPHIIHFTGHGQKEDPELQKMVEEFGIPIESAGLIFNDENGNKKLVKTKALGNFFKLLSMDDGFNINTVVLNACFTKDQAQAISLHVPYVIGMNNRIEEKSAMEFTTGFYRGLANGRSIEFCFQLGKNLIELQGLEGDNIVEIFKKS